MIWPTMLGIATYRSGKVEDEHKPLVFQHNGDVLEVLADHADCTHLMLVDGKEFILRVGAIVIRLRSASDIFAKVEKL